MKSQIPKRLSIERGCYYSLPDNTNQATLDGYELLFRAQHRGLFKFRVGLRYFFEFESSRKRDDFLTSVEHQARMAGLVVQREMIY